MARIAVESKVQVYELNGVTTAPSEFEVTVTNHRAFRDRVNITINGNTYTVVASDLEKAITNAKNAH